MDHESHMILYQNMSDFEKWRDYHLNATAERCKTEESAEESSEKLEDASIVNLPKCLVHFTKKLCKCNHECVGKSFVGSNIDTGCISFDTQNLWYDDNYKDCRFLKWSINNGSVSYVQDLALDENLSNQIMTGIDKLCHSKENFEDLLCKAYDLRDNCQNKENCMIFHLDKKNNNTCDNEEYDEQREVIERVLRYNFHTLDDLKSVVVFDESENLAQSETKNVYKRDLNILNDQLMTDGSYNDNLMTISEHHKSLLANNTYSVTSLTMISGLLMVFLAISGIKNNNKVIVIPALSLTTLMFIISIYLTLN